ncbi:MAG: MvaI/BcnI family restriction endonuclease [Tepidanaerobacteraceae bacterium]
MATLVEIQRRLEEIKDMGYIPTKRKGSTGVGHTFEQVFGLEEDNLQIPDIGGRVEVKTTRRNSGTLVTMFTFNRSVWQMKQKDVVMKYGYYSEKDRRWALYHSIYPHKPHPSGFEVVVDKHGNTLKLRHSGEDIAIWSIYRLVGALLYKLGKILFVIADSRIGENGREEFHFNEAYLLEDPSEERFIEAFEKSKVCLDIRMHLKENGTVRNHGTGFRMEEDELHLLFDTKRRLL